MSENIKGQAEEVRAFAGRLRNFSDSMRSNQSRLRGNFNEVSRSWRDSVQQSFSQEFDDANRQLDGFLREIDQEHLPYLSRKAQQIDEYTNG